MPGEHGVAQLCLSSSGTERRRKRATPCFGIEQASKAWKEPKHKGRGCQREKEGGERGMVRRKGEAYCSTPYPHADWEPGRGE